MGYEVSLDPRRVDRDWVWQMLSAEAYWLRWRTREDVEAQLDGAWRLAGGPRRRARGGSAAVPGPRPRRAAPR